MPKKNIELLKRLRTRFLRMRHNAHFKMKPIAIETSCGTAMCIAGHTLDLAGYKMRKRERPIRGSIWDAQVGRREFDFLSPKSGRAVSNPLASAQKELGLDEPTARELFHSFELKTPKQAARRIEALIE